MGARTVVSGYARAREGVRNGENRTHNNNSNDENLLFRFQITVNYAEIMKMIECKCELGQIYFHVVLREHELFGEPREKIAAAQERQHHVQVAVRLERCA